MLLGVANPKESRPELEQINLFLYISVVISNATISSVHERSNENKSSLGTALKLNQALEQ